MSLVAEDRVVAGVPFTAVEADVPLDARDWEREDWESAPLEMLEAEITTFAAHITAAMAQWLRWVGIYDQREGWRKWDMASCAHWLNWKCGVSLITGREHVRVAKTLLSLPALFEPFAQGRLSLSLIHI